MHFLTPRCRLLSVSISAAFFISACAVGPDYQRPAVSIPANYENSLANPASSTPASDATASAAPSDASAVALSQEQVEQRQEKPGQEELRWQPAQSAVNPSSVAWWHHYNDPTLNQLLSQIDISNQTIQAAQAQYRAALGALGISAASSYPALSAELSSTRSATSAAQHANSNLSSNDIQNTRRLAFNASWEIDLWGRISRSVESNQASAQASAADLQAARLSVQAALAQSYIQLRINDAIQQLFTDTVAAYSRFLEITESRYKAGIVARTDVTQAQTQLSTAQAQLIDLKIQRAQFEHAIAILLGKAPADFYILPVDTAPEILLKLPEIPLGVPSTLLERRPDIAAAERRVAAANAQIGIAQAAFFPKLILNADGGYQANTFSNLLNAPNRFWSLGPSLAAYLFDGGLRKQQKEQALALYDVSVANYRQSVLTGFQEVADNLAALRHLNDELARQRAAQQAAEQTLALTTAQYKAGTVSYLNVVNAQTTALSAARNTLEIINRRLLASVGLFKALGGTW